MKKYEYFRGTAALAGQVGLPDDTMIPGLQVALHRETHLTDEKIIACN